MMRRTAQMVALAIILGFGSSALHGRQGRSKDGSVRVSQSRTIPFKLYANAIWLNVRIGDSRPLAFQLDTAATSSVLNRSTAEEIGLQLIGEASQANAGSGDNETRIALFSPVSLKLDKATLDLPRTVAVPLDDVARSYGASIDGLIGYELMAQHVVKIDYDNRTISLFDPASFEYKGQGTALPLVLRRGREPIVRVRVGLPGKAPIEAEVLLDAPHPRTITFGSPFAREHNLRDSMLKVSGRLLPSAAFGVGGKTELESGRLEWIEIGPYALNFPDAAFASDAKGGAFARSDIAGIIGGELLRRFSVILDYSRARMILEPSLSLLDVPFETDASGLLVRTTDQSHHEFEVAGVFDGTPASEAGIQKADRILSIDGKPASELTLWELRTLFRKAPRRYTLILRRGTETKQITLRTRHLI